MSDKPFVVGSDGHVLSEKELEEAQRLDPPVSTGGAPDTRKATTKAIELDRMLEQIRKFEKRIEEHQKFVAAAIAAGRQVDADWEDKELDVLRRKKMLLEGRVAHLHSSSKS